MTDEYIAGRNIKDIVIGDLVEIIDSWEPFDLFGDDIGFICQVTEVHYEEGWIEIDVNGDDVVLPSHHALDKCLVWKSPKVSNSQSTTKEKKKANKNQRKKLAKEARNLEKELVQKLEELEEHGFKVESTVVISISYQEPVEEY